MYYTDGRPVPVSQLSPVKQPLQIHNALVQDVPSLRTHRPSFKQGLPSHGSIPVKKDIKEFNLMPTTKHTWNTSNSFFVLEKFVLNCNHIILGHNYFNVCLFSFVLLLVR